jgi:hypothetical protein
MKVRVPLRQSAEGKVRGKGREGVSRSKKARQWDERPSGEVKRMETLMTEALAKIKPTDPLR